MGRLSADLIVALHDKTSGPARGIGRSLDRLESRQTRFAAGTAKRQLGAMSLINSGSMRMESAMLARAGAIAAPAAAAYAGAAAYRDFAKAEREMTRTGLKLGASRETMAEVRHEMELIANKYAVPIQEVFASFDSLAESGFNFEEARSSLDGVVKATQGLGGSGQDTVNTFDAARKSINLAAADSEKFFDIIAAGGSMGKFEGSDLARYLPSLLPVVARQGYEGLEGAARLVGFLEVMRDFVGSSEEAATATQDIFEKISSPDVIKKFKEFGVNLEERLADARDNGEDVLVVLSDIIKEVTKGDATKLSQLFGDRDSRRAANVLLTQMDRVRDAQRKLLENSGGTIRHNVEVVTADAQAKIDRMSNSWERFKKSVGAGIAIGATPALDAITDAMDRGQAYEIGIAKQEAQGGSKAETRAEFDRRYGEVNPDFDWWNPIDLQDRSEAFVTAMQAYGRGDADSPYADLDRVLANRRNSRFPGLEESRKRAEAWAEQQAEASRGNLDGGNVRRGIPLPGFRPDDEPGSMSVTEQYRQYGRGRNLGEGRALDRRENMPVQIPDHSEAGSSGWRGGGFEEPALNRSRDTESLIRQIDRRLGELSAMAAQVRDAAAIVPGDGAATSMRAIADEMDRLIQRRRELDLQLSQSFSFAPPDITTPLRVEGERATLAASEVGTALQTALSVRATPTVDVSSIQAARREVQQLASDLRGIGGLARSASDSVASARADYSGLHADIERAG